MDENDQLCRLCRRESDHLESLTGIRDGLPLATLVMIICPIKIETKDALPKFICGDCLEIVMGAYKLRDESIESDRFFRESVFSFEPEQEFIEETEVDQSFVKSELVEYVEDIQQSPPPKKSKAEVYQVECFKAGVCKSPVWNYFGRLLHSNGSIVASEASFYFCRICVTETNSLNTKYSCYRQSTSMFWQHLKLVHGIQNENATPDSARVPSKPHEDSRISGLTFPCAVEGCDEEFRMKICQEIHQGLEHTGIADAEPANKDFHVEISASGLHNSSMAWNYFGPLVDSNNQIIDRDYNYCRLCVGDGNLTTKYSRSGSTTTLLHHLRTQHITVTSKRKRFESFDVSSVTARKD